MFTKRTSKSKQARRKARVVMGEKSGLHRASTGPTRPNLRPPWPAGTSGNPGGKRPGSVSLRRSISRVMSPADGEAISRRLISSAKCGSIKAVRALAELTGELGRGHNLEVNVNPPQPDPAAEARGAEIARRAAAKVLAAATQSAEARLLGEGWRPPTAEAPVAAKAEAPRPGGNGDGHAEVLEDPPGPPDAPKPGRQPLRPWRDRMGSGLLP